MGSLRVLIADDEAIIRMDLKEMLIEKGFDVVAEAANGEEAVQLLKSLSVDLAILDINMPKLDGLTVAKIIHKEKKIPIVILTAYTDSDLVNQAKDYGVYGYLIKPVKEEQIYPTLTISYQRFLDQKETENKWKEKQYIEQAIFVLQNKYQMTEQEAYQKIRSFSMKKRMSLKEIAALILKNEESS